MADDPTPELVDVGEQVTAVIRGQVPMAELPAFFDRSFGLLASTITGQGVDIVSAPFAWYEGPPGAVVDLAVGFPTDAPVTADGDVQPSSLPAGRVARLVHAGSYDQLGEAWGRLGAWMAEQGLRPGPGLWEVYLTEPRPDMDPADLRTQLNWLVADG